MSQSTGREPIFVLATIETPSMPFLAQMATAAFAAAQRRYRDVRTGGPSIAISIWHLLCSDRQVRLLSDGTCWSPTIGIPQRKSNINAWCTSFPKRHAIGGDRHLVQSRITKLSPIHWWSRIGPEASRGLLHLSQFCVQSLTGPLALLYQPCDVQHVSSIRSLSSDITDQFHTLCRRLSSPVVSPYTYTWDTVCDA